jgi:class 3 adenylate cyclase
MKAKICSVIRDDGSRSIANRIFTNGITALIIINIVMVVLELILDLPDNVARIFWYAEVVAVVIFTIEYLLRLWTADLIYSKISAARARWRFASAPMALIDIVAIVPFYIELFVSVFPINMTIIRAFRLLRLLRILKLNRYSDGKISEIILASIKEAIVVMDSEQHFFSANETAKNIFPAFRDMKKYDHMSMAKGFPGELLQLDEDEDKGTVFFEITHEKETFYQADISRVYDKENLLRYVIIIHDITASIMLEKAEKERIKSMFGRFVASEVVDELIAGNISVNLGGVLREVSILFVDIRGFTAFSEANPPEKVVEMVNRYLNLTSHSIQKFGGTIDKYIGDATMAMFNAPHDLENHALCAVQAALEMKRGSAQLRDEIIRDFGVDLQFGIGINTGQAIIGNMGSDFRMDYTVIGDTVNTAARIESGSQKGQVLISQAVYDQIKDDVEAVFLEERMFKNKKEGVRIFEVTGMAGEKL